VYICSLRFAEKPAERARPIRHEEPRREPGKFEGAGTYAGLKSFSFATKALKQAYFVYICAIFT